MDGLLRVLRQQRAAADARADREAERAGALARALQGVRVSDHAGIPTRPPACEWRTAHASQSTPRVWYALSVSHWRR